MIEANNAYEIFKGNDVLLRKYLTDDQISALQAFEKSYDNVAKVSKEYKDLGILPNWIDTSGDYVHMVTSLEAAKRAGKNKASDGTFNVAIGDKVYTFDSLDDAIRFENIQEKTNNPDTGVGSTT